MIFCSNETCAQWHCTATSQRHCQRCQEERAYCPTRLVSHRVVSHTAVGNQAFMHMVNRHVIKTPRGYPRYHGLDFMDELSQKAHGLDIVRIGNLPRLPCIVWILDERRGATAAAKPQQQHELQQGTTQSRESLVCFCLPRPFQSFAGSNITTVEEQKPCRV